MSARDLELRDAEARAMARTRFDVPVVLEAGAGTGKTATLVARVAIWCLHGGWERARAQLGEAAAPERVAARALERVVMITFTEKAAVEMELRIAAALRRLACGEAVVGLPAGELGPHSRERAGALADALDHLSVHTIHAFCSQLLARHALAAGVPPGFTVDADGSEVRAACAQVTSDALPLALGTDPDPDWLTLLQREQGPQSVLEALRLLVEARVTTAEVARDPYPEAELLAFTRDLAAHARRAAELLGAALGAKVSRNTQKAEDARLELAAVAELLDAVSSADGFPREWPVSDEVLGRLGKYAKDDFSGTERKALGEDAAELERLCASLVEELGTARAVDVELASAARGVLVPLLERVDARLAARGVLTFQDLLVRTGRLLAEDRGVRQAVRAGIDQLLVDEFQDTDGQQCDLVRAIALDGSAAERPGLFLVGDPKQSIYGWRSADLAAYEAMLAEVRTAGGVCAPLFVNYRSSQRVLDEVEALVAPLMKAQVGLQPEFQPLVEGRKRSEPLPAALFAAGRAAVEHWSALEYRTAGPGSEQPQRGKTSAETARVIEARRIAAELAELRAAGVALERCAILLRNATAQEFYLEALREAGVPYVVGKDRSYFQTREIVDAVALTAAILDPTDALSLVTFLRSPACGVPDAALAPLWRAGLPSLSTCLDGFDESALAAALAALESARVEAQRAVADLGAAGLERIPHWPLAAESGLRCLYELRRAFATLPADRAVERLRAMLCSEVGEAARFPGAHRLANLEHFFGMLVEALATGEGGAQGVLRELRAGLSGEREVRSAPPGDASGDAVRVLTVHAAKGLQFLAVWLADLHHEAGRARGTREPARVERLEGRAQIELFGCASLARPQLAARRAAVGAAETVRLLYVASTRAEDRLVLSGKPGKPQGTASLADLIAMRADGPAPWAELEASFDERGAAELERAGARWVLAGAGQPAPGETGPVGSEGGVQPAALDRQALARARAAAQARAERALLAPISLGPSGLERLERETRPEVATLAREPARAVGIAVHRALERWDIGQAGARERALEGLRRDLAARVTPAELEPAWERARELLERFSDSELGRRFEALGGALIGRELPLALAAEGDEGPTSAWVGAADLVWDAGDALVVADYKTDASEDDDALLARYGAQLGRYAAALRAALGRPVRAELWLLSAGRALDVPLARL